MEGMTSELSQKEKRHFSRCNIEDKYFGLREEHTQRCMKCTVFREQRKDLCHYSIRPQETQPEHGSATVRAIH